MISEEVLTYSELDSLFFKPEYFIWNSTLYFYLSKNTLK